MNNSHLRPSIQPSPAPIAPRPTPRVNRRAIHPTRLTIADTTPTMNNSVPQKRKPFGEAPRDIGNRTTTASMASRQHDSRDVGNPIKTAMMSSLRGRSQTQRVGQNSARGPPSSVTMSRRSAGAASSTGNSNTEDKARLYKAQAYEAKITIASQTQRIEALQAELEEVRLFADSERAIKSPGSSSGMGGIANILGETSNEADDAELIEALAQELECTEKDLKDAQSLVGRLEMELRAERKKNEINSAKSEGTVTTSASTSSGNSSPSREKEMLKTIERQKKELEKCKSDAAEGVAIMRDLEKALRVARSDRDAARLARDEASAALEGNKLEIVGVQNGWKRDQERCAQLEKQNKEVTESHSALSARYSILEQSLTELQNVLSMVQSHSEKKTSSLKEALSEAEKREEKSTLEYSSLLKRYNEIQGQCTEMEGVLTDLTDRFEEMKVQVAKKDGALKEAEEKYVVDMEEMAQRHAEEMEKQQSLAREEARVLFEAMMAKKVQEFQDMMKEMQLDHDRKMGEKDDLLTARQKQWEKSREEETQVLKAKILDMEDENKKVKSALMERDDEITCLKSDNAKLKTENTELSRQVENLAAMYDESNAQVKAKTLQLNDLSSTDASIQKEYETKLSHKENEIKQLHSQLAASRSAAAAASGKGPDSELIAANKALKRDLTSAVESSISRGKEIQALQNEIESYQFKLTKANQRMKRMEKSQPSAVNSLDNEERQRLESELNVLRTRAAEADQEKQEERQRLESEVNALRALVEEAEQENQLLENEVDSLQSQTENAREEKHQLESQLNDLRSHAQETEGTITKMKGEISTLSSRVSEVQTLERDLTNARLALANSQSRIFNLEEALKETQVALKVVSSARLKGNSPAGSAGKERRENDVIRRQIENDVLKEYVGQRM